MNKGSGMLLTDKHWKQMNERGLTSKTIEDFFDTLELEYIPPPDKITSEIIDWAEPVDGVFRIKGGWLDLIELDGYKEKQRELEEARKAEEVRKAEEARKAEEVRKAEESEALTEQQESAPTSSVEELWGDAQPEEENLVPKLPLNRAAESDDPYDVFSEVAESFLQDSEKREMVAFTDLMPEWMQEIEGFWAGSTREVDEEIALIAAQQYVIDTNKRLLPGVPVTNQYSTLLFRRANKHLKKVYNYTKWGGRVLN